MFYRDNLASTLHYRLGRFSNVNFKGPNIGLNENVLLYGSDMVSLTRVQRA